MKLIKSKKLLINIKNNTLDADFKYSFTSVSRSFLYKTSDEEIYETHVSNKYFETELYKKCLIVLEKIDLMSPSEYLNYVLEEFNYEECLLTIGNVKSFRVRTEYFYNLVKSFEEMAIANFYFINGIEYVYEKPYEVDVSTAEKRQYRSAVRHRCVPLLFSP